MVKFCEYTSPIFSYWVTYVGDEKNPIFYYRKTIYKGIPNFIHFNLALALLLGLIFFVSGIETVKDIKVRNIDSIVFSFT